MSEKRYQNLDTGETWTESEVKEAYEQFADEMEYDSYEDYLEAMLTLGKQNAGGLIELEYWYAAMKDRDDTDWGYGSFDLEEAKQMAQNLGEEAYIAVIKEGNDPICIEEIRQEDF